MSDELKPVRCRCGGASNIVKRLSPDYSVPVWYVECIKCNIETDDYFSEAEAVEAWNRVMGGSVAEKLKAFWDGVSAEMKEERTAKVEKVDTNSPHICGDNRFEIIAEAKKDLLETTNIGTSHAEMSVLDNFLFRCWQMGWLRQYETFEFCARGEQPCKEYDQDKHCCHRWTKVIRNTIEEIKTKYWRWIPVNEALPEEEVTVLVSAHYDGDKCYGYKANDYVTTAEYMDGRWFLSDEEYIMQLHKHHVIAWMQLPEGYRGE